MANKLYRDAFYLLGDLLMAGHNRKFIIKIYGGVVSKNVKQNLFGVVIGLRSMLIGVVRAVLFLKHANRWSSYFAGSIAKMTYEIRDDFRYKYVASGPLLFWRARTLFTKEPETVAWLKNIAPNEILYDIGANTGTYSIYAGVRGCKVLAFEPEASNFAVLNRNIYINNLSQTVKAYCIALSNETSIDTLRLSTVEDGAALHSFGTNKDLNDKDFSPVFEQGCLSTTLDKMLEDYNLPEPNYIKLDVDGLESNIIEGARNTLKNTKVRGVLVEINSERKDNLEMITVFGELGFKVAFAGGNMYGAAKNYIFTK